jgi:hypothetical protein
MEVEIKLRVNVMKPAKDPEDPMQDSYSAEEDLVMISRDKESLIMIKAPALEFEIDPVEFQKAIELLFDA